MSCEFKKVIQLIINCVVLKYHNEAIIWIIVIFHCDIDFKYLYRLIKFLLFICFPVICHLSNCEWHVHAIQNDKGEMLRCSVWEIKLFCEGQNVKRGQKLFTTVFLKFVKLLKIESLILKNYRYFTLCLASSTAKTVVVISLSRWVQLRY